MNRMSDYEFEKMLAFQAAKVVREKRNTLMMMGSSKKTFEDRKIKRARIKNYNS